MSDPLRSEPVSLATVMANDISGHHRHDTGRTPTSHDIENIENSSSQSSHNEESERQIFQHLLKPEDSYTREGIYWADLPLGKRAAYVSIVDAQETSKELGTIRDMMKKDPLSPVSWYFRHAVLPGAGLGLEGYVLFSIGNLSPIFNAAWKDCWEAGTTCDPRWLSAVTYLEVVGIIAGQVLVGVIGDWIGRRWGLIQDALIMFTGLIMLTASWGTTLEGWVICYGWALFFYGIGVGGEYPMTATAAMENATGAGRVSTKEDRLHRGRKVTMAFLMQGWGQFINQVTLILLLLIFHQGQGDGPYDTKLGQYIFRVSFAIPAVGTLWLVYYRAYKMPLASKQLEDAKKKSKVTGYDTKSLSLTFSYFGSRVLATAGTWFCNDVFFYGNKLFQSQFIKVLSPDSTSILDDWLWNLLNVGISLVGYYLASFLIDNKLYGRKLMMQVGFLADFILFVIPAFNYKFFISPAGIHAFQAMYFLSSFFNQFGPNSVTFLVAAEVFPTPVRATAHGFSAAIGKMGALLASVLYSHIDAQKRFYVVPWFGLAGMLLTWGFLPDTTGLDLKEQERRWRYIREGREHEYHGVAVHPIHLSLWERFCGVGKYYNAEADYQSKMKDLREEWETKQVERVNTEIRGGAPLEDGDECSAEIDEYFRRTTGTGRKLSPELNKVAITEAS